MTRIAFPVVAIALLGVSPAHDAAADPSWAQISFSATASNAPKILAAVDKLLDSEIGKAFPGRLLLQAHVADGDSPATHSFVPIYKSAAERETYVQKLQASPAWTEFTGVIERNAQPVSTVLYSNAKSWGDINDTDSVWIGHAFRVSDPAAFLAAIEAFLASETGKKSPAQVYLSAVVAGGISPVTHVISVGYASEAEMAAWVAQRNASADWAAYVEASEPVSDYLGASLARNLKAWGSASMQDIVAR